MLDFRALIEGALQALEQERPADAERNIRTALGMSPRDDQLLHLLGVALIRQQREEDAVEPLRKAISLNRRDPEYHNALGCALRNVGQASEGVESFQRALKLDPGLLDAHFNLGQAYQRMGEFGEAEQQFARLLSCNPRDVEVVVALSNLRWFLGDHERALQDLREAIVANPASGDLKFLLGEQLLALGRFEEGWFQYLWRVNRHGFLRKFGLAVDSPQVLALYPPSLAGVAVKLHAEQGIGDDLFFLRYAAELRGRGARVTGLVTPRLAGMVGRARILDEVSGTEDRIPPEAGYRMLGDLPYLLQAHGQPVAAAVRFDPLPEQLEAVTERLRGLARPLIGLTWRAGTGPEAGNRNVLYKEVPFGEFLSMASRLPGTLLILQREPRASELAAFAAACGPRAIDFSACNRDLEHMLALLARIDEYIGVSNTNMHLCAALGRTARVLVSRSVEFRWMTAGRESPWFPGFAVYRQGERGSWLDALEQIAADSSKYFINS